MSKCHFHIKNIVLGAFFFKGNEFFLFSLFACITNGVYYGAYEI